MEMDEEIISDIKRDYILSLAKSGKRVEKRGFEEFRPISLDVGIIEKAEGSARVRLGDTDVVVGVKAEIGAPFPDRPEHGVITTNAELVPLASPTFEAGPPNEDAIELARVVDRGIRESEALDLEKLCLIPGEKVWVIFIDMHILDYSGNLFDACSLGAISALWSTRIPEAKMVENPNGEKELELDHENLVPLPMKHIPVSLTAAKIGDYIMVDPSLDEERVLDSRLTITTIETGEICAMQKGGKGAMTVEDVKKVAKLSIEKGKELRKKVEEVINENQESWEHR